MVKIMENPIRMDDLGGKPTIFGNTRIYCMGRTHGVIFEVYAWPDVTLRESGSLASPGEPVVGFAKEQGVFWDVNFFGWNGTW